MRCDRCGQSSDRLVHVVEIDLTSRQSWCRDCAAAGLAALVPLARGAALEDLVEMVQRELPGATVRRVTPLKGTTWES
jgi:hypothetical protein